MIVNCANVLTGIVLTGRTTILSVGVMTGDASTLVKLLAHVVTSPFLKITSKLVQLLSTHSPYSWTLQVKHTLAIKRDLGCL